MWVYCQLCQQVVTALNWHVFCLFRLLRRYLQKIAPLRSDNTTVSIVNIWTSIACAHLRFNTSCEVAIFSQISTIAIELDTTS